jgi:hypothetical protein
METPLQNFVEQRFSQSRIQVMLDSDLADLYKLKQKYINRAVNVNPDRFPVSFCISIN